MSVLRKNLFYQASAQIGSKGLMFIAYMILARILGPELYGVFDYTFAYIQIIGGIFFDLGLMLIVIREISGGNSDIFSPALWFKGAGFIIGSLIILALCYFLELPPVPVIFLTCFFFFTSLTNLYICVFRSREKMYGETITLISQRIILCLFLIAIYSGIIETSKHLALNMTGAAFGLSAVTGFLLIFILAGFHFPGFIAYRNLKASLEKIKYLAKESLPLVGVALFWLIYYKIDLILLGLMSTKEQVGLYSASYKIMEATFVVPVIIMNAIYPRLTRLWNEDAEKFSHVFLKAVTIFLMLGSVVALIMASGAGPIIEIIFGKEFAGATGILVILIISSIAVYAGQLVTQALVIIGKQKKYLLISALAAGFNIVLNIILIPYMQAKGAALSTVVTEFIVTVLAGIIVYKEGRRKKGI